jgi:hypothetical protein
LLGLEVHPVAVSVKLKLALPGAIPVTTPLFVIVATPLLLLTQVPPNVGERLVLLPTHIVSLPVTFTVGSELTVIAGVGFDTHPVALFV